MNRPTDPGLLVQELIYAGLDAMRSTSALDLCAYLHLTPSQGPQLFLATPALASVDPTEAFTLFTALRDTLEHDHEGDETLLLGRYLATAVTTEGERSKGLHIFGSAERSLGEGERETLSRLARAVAMVVHCLEVAEAALDAPASSGVRLPVRVAVESGASGPRAEVSVSMGEEIRTGTAQEPTPIRAVVAAVIDAVDQGFKLIEATDGDVGGERAVMVLIADPQGGNGLGAALVGREADPLRAAAVAALDACARLPNLGPSSYPPRATPSSDAAPTLEP